MMKTIYDILHELHIPYMKHDHPAVFTVEDADKFAIHVDGGHTKNLFLTTKKDDTYYLLIVPSEKRVDMKKVAAFVHQSKLTFAPPEKLFTYLELTPGSVSPFGLINDVGKDVIVLVDKSVMEEEKIGFHPNINTATLIIKTDDFKRFLEWTGNKCFFVDV